MTILIYFSINMSPWYTLVEREGLVTWQRYHRCTAFFIILYAIYSRERRALCACMREKVYKRTIVYNVYHIVAFMYQRQRAAI